MLRFGGFVTCVLEWRELLYVEVWWIRHMCAGVEGLSLCLSCSSCNGNADAVVEQDSEGRPMF